MKIIYSNDGFLGVFLHKIEMIAIVDPYLFVYLD